MRLLLLTVLVCPLFAITNVGGDITENTVWGPTGNPPDSIYNLIFDVRVISPATLTIQPGTRVQSVSYRIEVYGSLIACGTPTEKVEFTSASPTPNPGDWPCIFLASEPSDSIMIKDCIIEYASIGLTIWTSSIQLENVQIAHCSLYGLESWAGIPVENCEFTDNGDAGIHFYGIFDPLSHPLIGNNVITNNTIGILITGGQHIPNFTTPNQFANNDSDVVFNGVNANVNDTLMWNPAIDGIDCYLQNTIVNIESTGVFRIAPGNRFKFKGFNNDIWCRGSIEAIGTEGKKIYFTSARQNPGPGDWRGLWLEGETRSSIFSHCVIEYASPGIRANDFFTIDSSTIRNCVDGLWIDCGSITNCSISNNESHGVRCHPSIDSILIINSIITGNFTGIYCEWGTSPYIYNNEIYGNTDWGVLNVQNDYWVMAEYNWWGDSTGPCDTSAVDTLYNPGGLGDRVSDHVDYDPWIQVYPGVKEENPVSIPIRTSAIRATILTGPLQLPQDKKCKVFDITGRVVMPDKIKPGIYFIEIDGKITRKVVKIR